MPSPSPHTSVRPSLLTGHFFLLPLLLLGVIGWFTAFVAQCVAQAQVEFVSAGQRASVVGVGWAVIWMQLGWLVAVAGVVVMDEIRHSRLAISTFGAVNIALSVVVIDRLVYLDLSSTKAVSAGYLILVIVNILLTLYFSVDDHSLLRDIFDKLATPAGLGTRSVPLDGSNNVYGANAAQTNNNNNNNNYPVTAAYTPASYGNQHASSIINDYSATKDSRGLSKVESQYLAADQSSTNAMGNPASVMDVTSPSLDKVVGKATALYSYKRNETAEPHEIGFQKGETLDILDKSSRWWVARRSDGEVGTIPSNYVTLIEPDQ